jgi:hypothetical protein
MEQIDQVKVSSLISRKLFSQITQDIEPIKVYDGDPLHSRSIGYYDADQQYELAKIKSPYTNCVFPQSIEDVNRAFKAMAKSEFESWLNINLGYGYYTSEQLACGGQEFIKLGDLSCVYFLGYNELFKENNQVHLYEVNRLRKIRLIEFLPEVKCVLAPILYINKLESKDERERSHMNRIIKDIEQKYEDINKLWHDRVTDVNARQMALDEEKKELENFEKEAIIINEMMLNAKKLKQFYLDNEVKNPRGVTAR